MSQQNCHPLKTFPVARQVMSLIKDLEEQYAALSADITAQIARLHIYSGASERRELSSKIDTNLADAQELLEQIGLEVQEVGPPQRQTLSNKLKCYQSELKRLQSEYDEAKRRSSSGYDSADDYEYTTVKDEQKQRLLDNSERIERTGNKLTEGYRIIVETEQIGTQVLTDLQHQRETIQSTRSKLRETNAELGRSSRVLHSMMLRALREKFVLYGVGLVFVVAVALTIYFSVSR